MSRWWRRVVERLLPWYHPKVERLRDARTETIRKRSIATRIRSERIVDEYRKASKAAVTSAEAADAAGEAVIEDARKDDP